MMCLHVIFHLVAVIAHMALVVVKSHVCILKERPDPAQGGALSWSLPYEEICLCDRVLAPVQWPYCPVRDEKYEDDELWFVDNPGHLTRSRNWGKDALDKFLKHTGYCASPTASDDVTTDISYDKSTMPPSMSPSSTERRAVLPSTASSTTDMPSSLATESSTVPPSTNPPSTESIQSGSTAAPSTRPSTTESSTVASNIDASPTDMPQSTAPSTAEGSTVAPITDHSTTKRSTVAPSTDHSTTKRSTVAPSTSPFDQTTIPVCRDYLGMENGDIPKSNVQASSEYYPAYAARINGAEHWSAVAADYQPWIQADIGYQTYVFGVVTQGDEGRGFNEDWITSFKVSTFSSPSDLSEVFVMEQGGETEKVFAGNTDPFSLKTTVFLEPVYAQIVRITCLDKGGAYFSIRFEIIGCKA